MTCHYPELGSASDWLCWVGDSIQPIRSTKQRAKKVVSDSPGLVDFAVGLVIFVLNLPDGQELFWGGNSDYRRIVIHPANQKGFSGQSK